jgi:hypothetical protein
MTKKLLMLGMSLVATAGLGYAAGNANLGTMTAPDELEWQELRPGSPLKMATLWGSPSEGEIAVLVKVPAGYVGAIHDHTGDYHGVNVAGTWRHSFEGGEERSQPLGSYVFQPAAKRHRDACVGPEDCIWFVHQHDKLDFVPKQ